MIAPSEFALIWENLRIYDKHDALIAAERKLQQLPLIAGQKPWPKDFPSSNVYGVKSFLELPAEVQDELMHFLHKK